jgi:DNA-binding beta-propeller fold protein YncE
LVAFLLPWRILRGSSPAFEYLLKLVCESADRIVTVRFDGAKAEIVKTTETRLLASDISGPHGIAFSPDRKNFFVSIGHGRPFGSAIKYEAETDEVAGQVQLGMFPATMDVSPNGGFVYVVNFNLHGDPVPSSVSVVDTKLMVEAARIPTCVMPHGSRVTRDGSRQYSACMMDDLLVEIDARRMKLARTFRLSQGSEAGFIGLPPHSPMHSASAHREGTASAVPHEPAKLGALAPEAASNSAHGVSAVSGAHEMDMSAATCQPTWAQPSVNGNRVFIACNKSNEIVEIDAEKWTMTRRIPAGEGVYNLAVSPDGKLLVSTNKRGASVSIFDLPSGAELVRLKTRRKVVHGVVISPDARYAFVTVEGIGSEPGTLEILDLLEKRTVTTLDTPPQAAGIDFWKMQARP